MPFGQWTQLAPHTSRSATLNSGTRPVLVNLTDASLRIDCTTLDPANPFTGFSPAFSDPAMQITLTTAFSWDGGVTFPESASTPCNGSSTGLWGTAPKTTMAPTFGRGIPTNNALGGRPTHYRATLQIINGPIDFGLSLLE